MTFDEDDVYGHVKVRMADGAQSFSRKEMQLLMAFFEEAMRELIEAMRRAHECIASASSDARRAQERAEAAASEAADAEGNADEAYTLIDDALDNAPEL